MGVKVLRNKSATYDGVKFDNLLDVEWAIFLDELGAIWRYKPAHFKLISDQRIFTPTFYIEAVNSWMIVTQGDKRANNDLLERITDFSSSEKTCVLLVSGHVVKNVIARGTVSMVIAGHDYDRWDLNKKYVEVSGGVMPAKWTDSGLKDWLCDTEENKYAIAEDEISHLDIDNDSDRRELYRIYKEQLAKDKKLVDHWRSSNFSFTFFDNGELGIAAGNSYHVNSDVEAIAYKASFKYNRLFGKHKIFAN